MIKEIVRELRRTPGSLKADKSFRSIVTNTSWVLGANVGGIPISIAQSIIVARALGVYEYGVIGIIVAFVGTVNRLASFRMDEFVVKYVSPDRERLRSSAAALKIAMIAEAGTSLLAFAIATAAAPLAARLFLNDTGSGLIRIYSFVILATLITESSTGLLQTTDNYRRQSLIVIATRSATLAFVLIAFFTRPTPASFLIAYVLGPVVGGLISAYSVLQVSRRIFGAWWLSSWDGVKEQWVEMRRFAISTNISATLSLVVKDSEALWLGLFRSPTEVGYYKLALSLAGVILIPGGPLAQALYPPLARAAGTRDRRGLKGLLVNGTVLGVVATVPLVAGAVLFGAPAIKFAYGQQFTPAYQALVILLLGMGSSQVVFWMRPALLALGRVRTVLAISTFNAVTKVPAMLLLAPLGGYLAMAFVLASQYLVGALLGVRIVVREARLMTDRASDRTATV